MDRKYEGLCKPSLLHMDFLYESGHLGIVGNPAGMTQLIMYPKKCFVLVESLSWYLYLVLASKTTGNSAPFSVRSTIFTG